MDKVYSTDEERTAYRILMGKGEGKTALARTILRWVDNIKMDSGEIEWRNKALIVLGQDKE
jgi:hypothetical protein